MKQSRSLPTALAEQWGEVRDGWRVILAGAGAIAVSMPTLGIYSLPYFMASWKEDFGWSRQDVGIAVTCLTLGIFLSGPLVGRACDRFGVRPVASISIVFFALGLWGMSFLSGSLAEFYFAYFLLAVVGAGAGHICYLRTVASWFEQVRGVALGFVGAGAGMWAAVAALLLPHWIGAYGWRSAWQLLAIIACAGLPLVILFLKERRIPAAIIGSIGQEDGMTMSEARRTARFWAMLLGIVLLGMGLVGLSTQMVPLVSEITSDTALAARAGALFGVSLMIGRLFTGVLLDRLPPHIVAGSVFLLPVAGSAAFILSPLAGAAMLGISLGLAAGGENDVVSFLVARHFGLRSFGEIFGWMFGALSLGAGIGPLLIRWFSYLGAGSSAALVQAMFLCTFASLAYFSIGDAGSDRIKGGAAET